MIRGGHMSQWSSLKPWGKINTGEVKAQAAENFEQVGEPPKNIKLRSHGLCGAGNQGGVKVFQLNLIKSNQLNHTLSTIQLNPCN